MSLIASDNRRVIVGLGKTGYSIACHLASLNLAFMIADNRDAPPELANFQQEFPEVPVVLGTFDTDQFLSATELFISPGIPLSEPAIAAAKNAGVAISGDIELFCRAAAAPVIAITGSNGKSTVTTLVGEMAAQAGKRVAVGGNLGTPALALLADDVELYVVELSSFQLERCSYVAAEVATVLNVSEDHLDHHGNMIAYHQAKHRVFRDCRKAVINRDDALSSPLVPDAVEVWRFGLGRSDIRGFGLLENAGERFLALAGEPLMSVSELKISGEHNISNALAALALGAAAALPMPAMLAALAEFRGLSHRCEYIASINDVRYINDSKGTNVGAAVSAIKGLAASGQVVLIAGGQAKGADLQPLIDTLQQHGRAAIFIGESATALMTLAAGKVAAEVAVDLSSAVERAHQLAKSGDVVLLSPACASFDMFKGYEQRGDVFSEAVNELAEGAA
ncbi:MAG: UDP-N-acetylmuramoyl-L-alanine--D-glutamate ligase [Spongiibacteraceae bacterium]